jgi:hypothetical protein
MTTEDQNYPGAGTINSTSFDIERKQLISSVRLKNHVRLVLGFLIIAILSNLTTVILLLAGKSSGKYTLTTILMEFSAVTMITPYNDGTTHVIFEPLDFIAKLAALAPKPRVNLTRFHIP